MVATKKIIATMSAKCVGACCECIEPVLIAKYAIPQKLRTSLRDGVFNSKKKDKSICQKRSPFELFF